MLDHIGFPVSNFEVSKNFYEKALAPLGIAIIMEVGADQTENGGRALGFGAEGKPFFWISEDTRKATAIHLSFTARDRKSVDSFYEAAIAAGGKDNGKPGIRALYHPNYYGAFVIDPDGNNIEAVSHSPE